MKDAICILCFIVLMVLALYFKRWLLNKAHPRHHHHYDRTLIEKLTDESGDPPIVITDDPSVETGYPESVTLTEGQQEIKNISVKDRDNVTISQTRPSSIKNIALTRVKPKKEGVEPIPPPESNPITKPFETTPPPQTPKPFPYLGLFVVISACWLIMLIVFLVISRVFT